MTTLLGTIGALLFVLCAIPLVRSTIRDGHARGVDATFLAFWFLGEVVMLAHVLMLSTVSVPLVLNYGLSILLTGTVCWYRAFPRCKSLEQMAKEMGNNVRQ